MSASTSTSTNPITIPPFIFKNMEYVGNKMEFSESLLTLLPKKMVDFNSLKANGYDVKPYFTSQGWDMYFEMLNGPIYPDLLRHFWMKAKVFTKVEAKQEELLAIERNPSLKGKSRKEMGLLEFTCTQIKSNVCGINLTFLKVHFNALLGLTNSGMILDNFEKDTRFREDLLHRMFTELKLKGKVKGMTDECRVLFKIIISSICPRLGGTDTISWPHRHLIYFLLTDRKVNLGDYLFERVCEAIFFSKSQRRTTIVHPRLLSDLLFQGRIVKQLQKFYPELVENKIMPEVLTANFLAKMHLINTKVVQPSQDFQVRTEDPFYVGGYPIVSELDCEEVIQNYLERLKGEGYNVTREMVPNEPIVSLYKPRQRKSKRKAETQEEQVQPDLLAQKKIKVAEESSRAPKRKLKLDDDEDDSEETRSDEETFADRLRKKQVPVSKGKTPKISFNEAEIGLGFTKPLRTIHPNPINISDSEEQICSTDELIKEGKKNLSKLTSSDKSQQMDKQVLSEDPLHELEKHLSPDSLNNHPFSHETTKPKSPSPQTQPQIETSAKQSSDPQPEISPEPIHSPTEQPKQTSPIKSPEPTSEPTNSEQNSEPNPTSSAEHVSPERVHTCVPCPSEVTVVHNTNSASESSKVYTIPFTYPTTSDPFGSISNQLYDDLLRLSKLKNRFLVCLSDVDVEVSAIKAKICDALDMVGKDIKAEIGIRDMEVVSLLRDFLARASLKRLTMFNHEEAEISKAAALSARQAADDMLLHVLNNFWVNSKLFKCLEDQRIETERIAQETALLTQEQVPMIEEQVLMIDYSEDGESSSDKGKAPMEANVDHLRVLEQAIEEQRSEHQVLATKVDKLDYKVDTLNNKFDMIIALLQKP
ncbi:uncharacterized protein LOC123904122 [Trifolium pratense]|nr:uncharacterized protein LOC123904122 [Trifolium pratense]